MRFADHSDLFHVHFTGFLSIQIPLQPVSIVYVQPQPLAAPVPAPDPTPAPVVRQSTITGGGSSTKAPESKEVINRFQ